MKKKQRGSTGASGIPENFLERLTEIVGASLSMQLRTTFITRPTTFRINRLKYPVTHDAYGKKQPDQMIQYLQQDGFKLERVLWYGDAYILHNKSKRELTETEWYKDGKIYIQSLASMMPPLVLDPQPGEKVLDLTAAPGSKTSQMAALMARQGELVANDNNKIRFFKLKHNLELLGVADPLRETGEYDAWKLTMRMEHGAALAAEFPNYFDKILLDAPCSAEARFVAGEPKTYGFWSERKIKEMAFKQRTLLLSSWGALKPGGTLVYSTCTLAPEENELQVARLLERFSDAELVEALPAAEGGAKDWPKQLPVLTAWKNKALPADLKKCWRIMPTNTIESFFIAKIQKTKN